MPNIRHEACFPFKNYIKLKQEDHLNFIFSAIDITVTIKLIFLAFTHSFLDYQTRTPFTDVDIMK